MHRSGVIKRKGQIIIMRKTKIVCTLGPSTDKEGILEALVMEGMDVARFNMSHGLYDEQRGRLEQLKALRKKHNRFIAALLDTKDRKSESAALRTEVFFWKRDRPSL